MTEGRNYPAVFKFIYRHLSLSIILIILLSILPIGSAAAMNSEPSYWAVSDVQEAVSRGFVPDKLKHGWTDEITRGEFCELAVQSLEAMGYQFETSAGTVFDDTSDEAVNKAVVAGIVQGVGDRKFSPGKSIRRQDAAVILYRIAELEGFPDIDSSLLIPNLWNDRKLYSDQYINGTEKSYFFSYAYDAVAFCNNAGIMSGTGNNCFSPNSSYTKEQAVITFLRLYRWKTGTADSKNMEGYISTLPDDNRSYEYGYRTEGGVKSSPSEYDYYYDYLVASGDEGITIYNSDGEKIEISLLGSSFKRVKFLSSDYAQVGVESSDVLFAVDLVNKKIVSDKTAGVVIDDFDGGTVRRPDAEGHAWPDWHAIRKNMDGTYIYEADDALYFTVCDEDGNAISPDFYEMVSMIQDLNAYIECLYGRYIMGFEKTDDTGDIPYEFYMCDRYGNKLSDKLPEYRGEYISGNGSNMIIISPNNTYKESIDGLTPGDAAIYDDCGNIVYTFKNVYMADFYGPLVRIREADNTYSYYTPTGIKIK